MNRQDNQLRRGKREFHFRFTFAKNEKRKRKTPGRKSGRANILLQEPQCGSCCA